MTPYETDLMHAAAEVARAKRLWAQAFLINTTVLKTDGQAKAAADEDHIEQVIEAEAKYEIAKSRLINHHGGAGRADPIGDQEDQPAHDPSQIEC